MKRLNYLVILGILGMLILAMEASIPAGADAPVHPVHTKYVWTEDFPYEVCNVTVAVHQQTKLEYIIYCDRNDTCRGDNYHYNEYFILTYGDHSFTMHHAGLFGCTWLTEGEPVDEICRQSGGMLIGTLPGHGVVSGWAGLLRLGLGVEQGIKVSRNTAFEEKTAGLMRGSLALRHEIRIAVANRLERPALVEVRERIPVPATEDDSDIEVVVLETRPAAQPYDQTDQTEAPIRGGRRWEIDVAPGKEVELSAVYEVRIAGKHELVGGNRREA